MDFLNSLKISSSGLYAQRRKMNVIAENLANVETTQSTEGGPYKRKMVIFQEQNQANDFRATLQNERHKQDGGVKVAQVVRSQADFRRVYKPEHPHADGEGYVTMPNISPLIEIIDMMVAQRAYEANAAAIANTKSMIMEALKIGQ